MLDKLPPEIWLDSSKTFLDPACSTGIFLLEIVRKLNIGLASQMPDQTERLKHILTKQVWGLESDETPLRLARWAFRELFIDTGIVGEVNIYRANALDGAKEIKDMKFDVVVGNPPYNGIKPDGTQWQSMYIEFVKLAHSISDTVILVVPAQWMTKQGSTGKIEEFKCDMLNNLHLTYLKYYNKEYASSLFDWPMIIGGVCYFVLNKKGTGGDFTYTNANSGVTVSNKSRVYSRLGYIPVNDPCPKISLRILEKAVKSSSKMMSDIFKRGRIGSKEIERMNSGNTLCHRSKQRTRLIDASCKELTDLYQKRVAYKYANGSDVTEGRIVLKDGETVTESFMYFTLGCNEDPCFLDEVLSSKVIVFLRMMVVNSHNNTKKTWSKIPRLDFSRSWTDQQLYQHFNLTQEEINYIEETVK